MKKRIILCICLALVLKSFSQNSGKIISLQGNAIGIQKPIHDANYVPSNEKGNVFIEVIIKFNDINDIINYFSNGENPAGILGMAIVYQPSIELINSARLIYYNPNLCADGYVGVNNFLANYEFIDGKYTFTFWDKEGQSISRTFYISNEATNVLK